MFIGRSVECFSRVALFYASCEKSPNNFSFFHRDKVLNSHGVKGLLSFMMVIK